MHQLVRTHPHLYMYRTNIEQARLLTSSEFPSTENKAVSFLEQDGALLLGKYVHLYVQIYSIKLFASCCACVLTLLLQCCGYASLNKNLYHNVP